MEDLVERYRCRFVPLQASGAQRQRLVVWPIRFIRRPENGKYLVELRYVAVHTLQERPPQQQLRKDTADAPHVCRRAVLVGAQQEFRRFVPQRNSLGRQPSFRRPVHPCQAKIGQFHRPVLQKEHVVCDNEEGGGKMFVVK